MRFFYLFLAFSFSSIALNSNDSSVAVAQDGTFYYIKSDEIELLKEHLVITPEQIRVDYDFFNKTKKEKNAQVAFPLPLVSAGFERSNWDPLFYAYQAISPFPGTNPMPGANSLPGTDPVLEKQMIQSKPKNMRTIFWGSQSSFGHAPFLNFRHFTADQEAPHKLSEQGYAFSVRAFNKGKDITELLVKNNIPLSPPYLGGNGSHGAIDFNPTLKQKLRKLGLLIRDKRGYNKLMFQTQTIFHWNASFEPQKITKTAHTYKPQSGSCFLDLDEKFVKAIMSNTVKEEMMKLQHYDGVDFIPSVSLLLLEEKDKKHLIDVVKGHNKKGVMLLNEVRYILTTARNWSGSIKDFTLEVPIPKGQHVFIVGIDGAILEGEKLVVRKKNFVPQKDLRVLYMRQIGNG